jgi:hypothetical protein
VFDFKSIRLKTLVTGRGSGHPDLQLQHLCCPSYTRKGFNLTLCLCLASMMLANSDLSGQLRIQEKMYRHSALLQAFLSSS